MRFLRMYIFAPPFRLVCFSEREHEWVSSAHTWTNQNKNIFRDDNRGMQCLVYEPSPSYILPLLKNKGTYTWPNVQRIICMYLQHIVYKSSLVTWILPKNIYSIKYQSININLSYCITKYESQINN